jgi:hypothetical protein
MAQKVYLTTFDNVSDKRLDEAVDKVINKLLNEGVYGPNVPVDKILDKQ